MEGNTVFARMVQEGLSADAIFELNLRKESTTGKGLFFAEGTANAKALGCT